MLTTQPENPIHFRKLCRQDGPVREIDGFGEDVFPHLLEQLVVSVVVGTRSSGGSIMQEWTCTWPGCKRFWAVTEGEGSVGKGFTVYARGPEFNPWNP